ncbi:MAG: hypothetical protein IPI04_11575 [Ignavibacteria bacterium]|nr:hypothetical protein [Ignavibacteria bacterium]
MPFKTVFVHPPPVNPFTVLNDLLEVLLAVKLPVEIQYFPVSVQSQAFNNPASFARASGAFGESSQFVPPSVVNLH